ncbi:MAG: hypothetical protein JSR87_13725 [Proteobacteria bacterium]|nr:hypothetical protein [Pseudomonadota bacterium]MBS0571876.1 hypothetical protein [Pseudomonadota bacterium]
MGGLRRFGMIALAFAAAVAALGTAVRAGPLRVQAGEHDRFTRLVVTAQGTGGWVLGRTSLGYALQLPGAGDAADLSGALARISRRRIADLTSAGGTGRIDIALGCDCHATAFEMSGGRVVIDIADGAPAKSSPFEADLPTAAAPETAGQDGAAPAETAPGAATLAFRPGSAQAAGLPPLWQGAGSAVRLDPPAPAGTQKPQGRDARPATSAPNPSLPPVAPLVQPAPPVAPAPQALPPEVPARAIRATEDALLIQLGRAASQGLVERPPPHPASPVQKPDRAPDRPASEGRGQPDRAPGVAGETEREAADGPRAAGSTREIAFLAETSLDRDSRDNPALRHLTADGGRCIPDGEVAIAGWGRAGPVAPQLAEARAGLTGEFDRPDPAAVARLAKLHLYLGMGAEARQVLAAFPVRVVDGQLLTDMARIVDDEPVGEASVLPGLRDCDTQVALWALLATPAGADARDTNSAAVVRGFSGLPAGLRHLLARRLAARLTAIGAADAARSIRNALAREAGPEARIVGMMDAERALRAGRAAEAEVSLDRIARGNDALSAEAALLAVEARTDQGAASPPALTEAVSALAFERRNDPDGPRFAAAAITARAASGDIGEAFAAYRRWQGEGRAADRQATAAALFARLTERADDGLFLREFFTGQDILVEAGAEAPARLALAGRLASLGFAAEAGRVLSANQSAAPEGRLVLARAALVQFRPDDARTLADGIAGGEAEAIRAAALTMAGRPGEAAAAYAATGNDEASAAAAWSAGDWTGAARSERFRAAAEGLGLTGAGGPRAPAGARPEAGTTLAGSRALVERSSLVRKLLGDLLAAEGAPVPPPAAAATATP